MNDISLKISILSLLFSLVALCWNILKDILLDRIKLNLRMFVGEDLEGEKGIRTAFSSGSEIEIMGIKKTASPKKVFFYITNVGRRDIEVDCLMAKYKDKSQWYLPINTKKYLKPYETTTANSGNLDLLKKLRQKQVEVIYIKDSKGKKWYFPKNDIEKSF